MFVCISLILLIISDLIHEYDFTNEADSDNNDIIWPKINDEVPEIVGLGWMKDSYYQNGYFGCLVSVNIGKQEKVTVVLTRAYVAISLRGYSKTDGQPYALFYGEKMIPILDMIIHPKYKDPKLEEFDMKEYDIAIGILGENTMDAFTIPVSSQVFDVPLQGKDITDTTGLMAYLNLQEQVGYNIDTVQTSPLARPACTDKLMKMNGHPVSEWIEGNWLCVEPHGRLMSFGLPYFDKDSRTLFGIHAGGMFFLNIANYVEWIGKAIKEWKEGLMKGMETNIGKWVMVKNERPISRTIKWLNNNGQFWVNQVKKKHISASAGKKSPRAQRVDFTKFAARTRIRLA